LIEKGTNHPEVHDVVRRIGIVFLLSLVYVLVVGCRAVETILPTPTSAPSAADYILYDVRAGETSAQLATRFHLTIEQLISLNADRYPLLARDPSQLQPGWRLRVPTDHLSPSARAVPDAARPQSDLVLSAKYIVDGTNLARAQRGLPLLRTDAILTRIADDRSLDLIARDYFSHDDPQTGQEPLLRYLQAYAYAYQYAGENIAELKNGAGWVLPWQTVAARYGPDDLASEFVKNWLNSPGHRADIVNPHYLRTGVGLAVDREGYRIVATQVFSD
jgi:uncharacterized protein YkwD